MTQDQTRASYDAVAACGRRASTCPLSDEQAAKRHPDLTFSTGSMTALPAADAQPYPGAEVATPRAYILARAV